MSTIALQYNPLKEIYVTSAYGQRSLRGSTSMHKGLDLRAAVGTPVFAAADGVVHTSKSGTSGYGVYVVLTHNNGEFYTIYGHLSSRAVSEGATVKAGQQIGLSGNTGNSTGPHLHFEIRTGNYNSRNTIDPQPLLGESIGTPVSTGPVSSVGTESSSAITYTSILKEYETVHNIDIQPFLATVNIWIGSHLIPNIPPQYLLGFEYQELADSSGPSTGYCTMTLFDKYGDEFEETLIRNQSDQVIVQFGHVTGRQSRILHFLAETYNVDRRPAGSILTVRMIPQSAESNLQDLTLYGGQSPSDAVRTICEAKGWQIGRIDNSYQLPGSDGQVKEFTLVNRNALEYINKEIAPRAMSTTDGRGGFQFYLQKNPDGTETANFHPIDIDTKALRTYVYQKGKNSPVLSFGFSNTFNINSLAGVSYVSTIAADGIDLDSKEEYNHSVSTGDNLSKQQLRTDGMTYEEAKNTVNYRFIAGEYSGQFKANMTLVGDPTLQTLQQIRVIILNEDNSLYHASGVYEIRGVSHNISGGVLVTVLELLSIERITTALELSSVSEGG